ncbi:hypothetical protein ACFVUS_27880 [Nocardia sp. NPDC058058]|uniref:hypothetical protein n=1 Tax=Nocardia sp. NPDC058058 TaxID=3346317 RepID=UPI0036DA85C2
MEKLNREQLIDLVGRLISREGGDEETQDRWMDQIESSVSDPNIVEYIYHDFSTPPLTPEQIVDKALAYQPIALGGPE